MRQWLLVAFVASCCSLPAQNSSRKIRTAPSDQAARVGSAVAWHDDVASALAAAKKSGKPVFWYVPTVRRSPMDRKPEIDRYMRGGPFSWPTTIELLNNNFVPVDEVPSGELQQRYGLVRQKFIEPGYVVLDGDGEVLLQVDQITTMHPQWFEAPLRRLADAPLDGFPGSPALREAWDAYRRGEHEGTLIAVEEALRGNTSKTVAMEAHYLWGIAWIRNNGPDVAFDRWRELVEAAPDQPLAWKMALEIEGHGPFVRGFEDYLPLPDAVLTTAPWDGSRAPIQIYDENTLWQRSVHFLLRMDDGKGVLRDSTYDFGGTDGLPNVYAAVTCLAGMALLAAEDRVAHGDLELDAPTQKRLGTMLDRIRGNASGEAWLAESDRDEIVWARAYAVRFLAAWAQRRGGGEAGAALSRGVGALLLLQPETGAWFHEYGNPFATATALQALADAKAVGCEIDDQKIARGLAALAKNRTEQGAFSYGHTRGNRKPRATVEAAAGRMPLCELALFLFDKSDQERLANAVAQGQRHHGLLAGVRKYDDHADRHGYGGFFFWFDMLGRAEAVMRLDDTKLRASTAAELKQLVLDLPEFDGCFVDSHEIGRCYGTAMALLCLDVLGGSVR